MTPEKRLSLTTYVQQLKQRLAGPVPAKHVHRAVEFKQMLEIDLKKTLSKLESGG